MAADETQRPVLWISHGRGDRCAECGDDVVKGAIIQLNREQGVRCATCAGFGDLVYLPSGNVALTRRAVALSSRSAVVVQFSRARKRNERRGVLVEAAALAQAQAACEADAAARERKQTQRRAKDEVREAEYQARFASAIRQHFPRCPVEDAQAIALRACEKWSGRVGRSAAAKALDARAINLAVRAHVRHKYTRYDQLLAEGLEPPDARPLIAGEIAEVLERWRGPDPPTESL